MNLNDEILKLSQAYETLVRSASFSAVDAAESAPIRIALVEHINRLLRLLKEAE